MYEGGAKPGLAAHSNDFSSATAAGQNIWGDVPARMFNSSLWPSLTTLYHEAGIESESVNNSQTFYDVENGVFMNAGLPYRLRDVAKNSLSATARQIMNRLSLFREKSLEQLLLSDIDSMSFGTYIGSFSGREWKPFFARFLFPTLTSTVFTCPSAALMEYPCRIVLEALQRITESQNPLSKTKNGSLDAARKLSRGVNSTRYSTPVTKITEFENGVVVQSHRNESTYDQVVIATQANHAARLVARAWTEAAKVLKQFIYVDVPVVVHQDCSVMPKRKSSWSTFNFRTVDTIRDSSSCTVWMNQFHGHWPGDSSDVFHTIFPDSDIDPTQVISEAKLQRPVVSQHTSLLINELHSLSSQNRRLWFVGSYATQGVPLLESAVRSSYRVADQINARYRRISVSSI